MRIQTEVLVERYQNHLFAAAFHICKNAADAEDVVQETFLKYHTSEKEFDSEQHIRAWLIRVAINAAKNINLAFWRRACVPLEDYMDTLPFEAPEDRELMRQVLSLKEKYRIVIHLYYYEDYSVKEIASILHLTESAVKVRLSRGRELLKNNLKGDMQL